MEMVIKIGSKTMSVKMLILLIVLLLIGGVITVYISNKELTEREEKYHLVHIDDSFRACVSHIYFNHETYLTLNDSIRICLFSMKNQAYKPFEFYKFIQRGDTIVKNTHSDTIYLYRKNIEYYFILDEIHEELYKDGRVKKKGIIDDNVLRLQ